MKKANKIALINIVILAIFSMALYYMDIVELNILLIVYLPFIGLALYRNKKKKEIKDIYKFFKGYTWLLILIFCAILVGLLTGVDYTFPHFGFLTPFINLLEEIWYYKWLVIIIVLFFAMLKVNSYLLSSEQKTRKFKINKKLIFVLLVIIIMGVLSYLAWDHAYYLESQIIDIYGWENPEITNMERQLAFSLVFKEIVLYNGFVFLSTFLILYTLKKNDKNNS